MVPTVYMELDDMPQTLNGKTDLRNLPDPVLITEYVAPENEIETVGKAETVEKVVKAEAKKVVKAETKSEIMNNIPEENITVAPVQAEEVQEDNYFEETRFEVKPSLWQRIKQSRVVRTMSYIFKIKVRLELPDALPEGRG